MENSLPLQNGKTFMSTSLAEILVLRSQWEELVQRFRFVDDNCKHGTINNLEWFVNNGFASNRLRKNYDEAKRVAEEILEKANEVTF